MKLSPLNKALVATVYTAFVIAGTVVVTNMSFTGYVDNKNDSLSMSCDDKDHDYSAYTTTNKCGKFGGEDVYITRVVGESIRN